jgi:signal transduction histidine kinase
MDVGVLLLTPDGTLEFANAAALAMFACSSLVELQQRWTALTHAIPSLGEAPQPGETEVEIRVSGETPARVLCCTRYRFGEPGGGASELMVMTDRAQRDALGTDLRLATQLRTLARLAGTLAHDLKGPLNAMVINLELLQDVCANGSHTGRSDAVEARRPGSKNVERQQRYFAALKSEIARINELLNRLVSQTGYQDDVCQVELHGLVNEVHALLGPQAKLQRVSFTTDVTERPVVCHGHRVHLKQAMLNLGVNALEAMPGGGDLALSLQVEGNQGIITIVDSGPGIAPSISPNVGRMYFTTKATGTGIGVYVARGIVQAHGGTLTIESQPGHGTCCRINLPLETQEK